MKSSAQETRSSLDAVIRPNISVSHQRIPENLPDGKSFVLLFIRSGTAKISAGNSAYSIIGPACACLNETEPVKVEPSDDCSYSAVSFEPSAVNSVLTAGNIRSGRENFSVSENQDRDYLGPFFRHTGEFSGIIQLDWIVAEKIASLIKSLESGLADKDDKFWPCRSRSHLLETLFLLFSIHHESGSVMSYRVDDSLPGRIIHFIHSHYSERISVPEICRQFNTNKTTVSVEIKKATGLSVIDYTNRIRVHSACILLRSTTLPVQEIMYRTGFNDAAHFGRIFKKFARMAPSAYRDEYSQFRQFRVNP
jgi:AraC family L-rhamnose operon regulatory protein RhaS